MTGTIDGARGDVDARTGGRTPLSREARLGAVIAALAVLLLALLAAAPFLLWSGWAAEAREERRARDMLAARLASRPAGAPRLGLADGVERMFLAGATDGGRLAALQSLAAGAAERSGIAVLRLQPLDPEAGQGRTAYRLAVEGRGSLEQLRAFLAGIEAMLPLVIVTGLDIAPSAAGGEGQDPFPSEALAFTVRLEAQAAGGAP